jgi:predicted acylesterase/phospholipase RssA
MPSSPSEPISIQVVFQGGGAKLCTLMAVCSVLKQYEAEKRIKLTRVAGSSAGAIAAVMVATKKSPETYKAEIQSIAPRFLTKLNVARWRGAVRLVRGTPIFSDLNLEDFFNELICKGDGPKKLNDLPIPAELYFTDLYSLEARFAPSDEPLPKALAKSCRFPFAFVGFGSGNTEVDGGLALNLPVDHLKRDESTKGPVIGVSFLTEHASTDNSNLLSYTQQLFSAAIQSSVARSEAIVGKQNVFAIDTQIGTFDFEAALKDGLGVHYKLAEEQFKTWLDAWLRSYGPIEAADPGAARKLLRPTLSNVPLAPAVIREIDDRYRSEPCTRATSIGSYETAVIAANGEFAGKYRARTFMTCSIVRPTNLLQFDFQIGSSGSFAAANLGCSVVNNKGNTLRFAPDVQELTRSGQPLRSFRVYFLFDEKLMPDSPDQPYVLEYQYEGDDPYLNLGKRPEHSVFFCWQGEAREMRLVVAFPRSKLRGQATLSDIASLTNERLRTIGYESEEGEMLIVSEEMAIAEFVEGLRLDQDADKYLLVGRRVQNVKQGQGFGFTVE